MTEEQYRLILEIKGYLNLLSGRVGEVLTEYDWRECCGLELALDEIFLNAPIYPKQKQVNNDTRSTIG